ncbi:PREDICTED: shugoshin-1-like [Ipomoea nil]|uniref:shugoshin-1-like n=1 Tax=Ipomoea nil TaxID=35883 RepID=UPI000901DC6D|nr:PREDICTED: shugoshin-1-like [Ipomoea nil]
MLEMEGLPILDSKKIAPPGDKPKIEKAANTAFGKAARKTLADISNVQPQMRTSNQNEKPQNIPMDTKQYIAKLEKENMALIQMLGERTKIIELTGIEIQKMRTNMQKLQQQNQQLAQSNSQMLAELNSGKDRLKALQHELGCKNGLLKAKKLEAEDKSKKETCQYLNNEVKSIKSEEPGDSFKVDNVGSEPENTKRRRVSKSLGPSKQVQSQNNAEGKRQSVRRQSARFKKEDLLEIDDSKTCACEPSNDPIQENGSTSTSTLPENVESNNNGSGNEARELGRSSMSRPLRQAAKKVQCYKEIPLNVKMRRSE